MEDFLILMLVLTAVAIPVAVIYLLVAVSRLRRRVAALEAAGHAPALPAVPEAAPAPAPRPDRAADPGAAQRNPWGGVRVAADPAPDTPVPPVAIPAPSPGPRIPAPAGPGPVIPAPLPADTSQDRPLVFRGDRIAALGRWLVQNWVYALSALSLALAGIFLVQYGVQRGLLPPPLRVLAALALGGALVAGGEYLRRRHGDSHGTTATLPSTFSAAGIVIAFAAILSARQMYGLIGPLPTFAGLLAVAAGALYLGWRHTPALAAMGLIGAGAAPFLTGGSAESLDWLYAYAALIAATGLGIDAFRRWAWISALALVMGYGMAQLIHLGGGSGTGMAMQMAALPALAFVLPNRSLRPALAGASTAGALWHARRGAKRTAWPAFPIRLVAGAMAASTIILLLLEPGAASWPVLLTLAAMAAGGMLWAARAPAVSDLLALPVAGFVLRLILEADHGNGLAQSFAAAAIATRPPESAPPATVSAIVLLAALIAATAGWRALAGHGTQPGTGGPERPRYWALIAAAILPVTGCVIEVTWAPVATLGAYPWALHAMAAAAMMTGLAILLARAGRMPGAAYATLSVLVLIAFAMVLILTKAALTLALAVLIVAAAALDRRFRLPEMGWFIQAAIAVLGWRLVADPGLGWALDAPLVEVLAAYGGAVAAAAMGQRLLVGLERPVAAVVLDSALWVFAALLADVLIYRAADALILGGSGMEAWRITLLALPWLALSLGQMARLKLGGPLRLVRIVLAAASGGLFALLMAAGATIANPLVGFLSESRVWGPPLFDTLALAYALPGVILIWARRGSGHLPRWLRLIMLTAGAALLTLYALLEIRSWFHGRDLSAHGVTQGELYTYTMAMMATGGALLWQALAKRSVPLRRLAMTVIAITVAKVFLIDASGLTGLTRVASFLALGLSLAGLAWLNRWAAERQTDTDAP